MPAFANLIRFVRIQPEISPPGAGSVTITPASNDGYYREGSLITGTITANETGIEVASNYIIHNSGTVSSSNLFSGGSIFARGSNIVIDNTGSLSGSVGFFNSAGFNILINTGHIDAGINGTQAVFGEVCT